MQVVPLSTGKSTVLSIGRTIRSTIYQSYRVVFPNNIEATNMKRYISIVTALGLAATAALAADATLPLGAKSKDELKLASSTTHTAYAVDNLSTRDIGFKPGDIFLLTADGRATTSGQAGVLSRRVNIVESKYIEYDFYGVSSGTVLDVISKLSAATTLNKNDEKKAEAIKVYASTNCLQIPVPWKTPQAPEPKPCDTSSK